MAIWANPASFNTAPATESGLIRGADPGAVLMSLPGGAGLFPAALTPAAWGD